MILICSFIKNVSNANVFAGLFKIVELQKNPREKLLLKIITLSHMSAQILLNGDYRSKIASPIFLDTGRKLNEHKTFRSFPERLLNALCTFN